MTAFLACAPQLAGQSFEVASIRRNLNDGEDRGVNLLPGGRISVTHTTLKTLIRNAYGIFSFQLAGEPGWMDSEYYDIEAKTGTGEDISPAQLKPYLQALLADRFHLTVHWEKREGDVYALEVEKSGTKMIRNSEGKEPGMNVEKNNGRVRMKGVGVPMAMLASSLGNQLGRIVVDETGLTGAWDFQGAWTIAPPPDSTDPSIFTGVREQLGLRLAAKKGSIETLVVDHAEKASEN
ncbi:MAG TPA: TIGR03435 family protein [Bryobacteraceae bacterium]|nr:TIGR03435 family protein [Bryobacteraceae bacterium]